MRTHGTHAALFGVVVLAAPVLVAACKKNDASGGAAPANSYGFGYAQAQPSATSPVSSGAAASAAPPPAAASGPLATPGAAALPCTSDAMCVAHRCNVAAGKCAFPCETDADCVPGNFCFKGAIAACLAKPPGQASQ